MNKPTLVVGASPNPYRYAHLAVHRLNSHGHPVIAFGLKPGMIGETPIIHEREQVPENIDTLTLYLGPTRQEAYKDWFIELAPRRIIFNPGTENPEFEAHLREKGIETLRACTLVMLSTGQY